MFYEKDENLTDATLDQMRASKSLREELEAVDYYQERIDATKNEELNDCMNCAK
jgi:hypothetical protein